MLLLEKDLGCCDSHHHQLLHPQSINCQFPRSLIVQHTMYCRNVSSDEVGSITHACVTDTCSCQSSNTCPTLNPRFDHRLLSFLFFFMTCLVQDSSTYYSSTTFYLKEKSFSRLIDVLASSYPIHTIYMLYNEMRELLHTHPFFLFSHPLNFSMFTPLPDRVFELQQGFKPEQIALVLSEVARSPVQSIYS